MAAKKKRVEEPEIADDLKDEGEQEQAKRDFRNLQRHRGWKRIVDFYTKKAEYHQDQLNGDIEDDIKTLADLELIRFKRNISLQLTNLPEILMERLEVISDTAEEENADPFETAEELDAKLGGNK